MNTTEIRKKLAENDGDVRGMLFDGNTYVVDYIQNSELLVNGNPSDDFVGCFNCYEMTEVDSPYYRITFDELAKDKNLKFFVWKEV